MKETKKQWEFYENLNEMVYAADIDTQEVLYLNRKAREMFRVASAEVYRGQMCYRLFQGRSAPCETCNNALLKPGEFQESVYFNPVLGRTYALKDTLLEEDGRRVRLEIAIDVNTQQKRVAEDYLNNEAILNEALRLSLAVPDPDEAINILLARLGQSLQCDRMYIFEEQEGHLYSNTYEWCAHDVVPQIDNLQGVDAEVVTLWMERFQREENVVITDMERVREQDPVMYSYLAPQDIHALVAGPLTLHGKVLGFYGVDNPPASLMENIYTLFQTMGYFIVSLLRRQDLLRSLENLSRQDLLTGCGNRRGMEKFLRVLDPGASIGVVYCDVMGLKRVNDSCGHQAGDDLLRRASRCLLLAFPGDARFRIGGDEFLVLCTGGTQEALEEKVASLRQEMEAADALMAVGQVWYPACPQDFDRMLSEADARMYEEKKRYYANRSRDRRQR